MLGTGPGKFYWSTRLYNTSSSYGQRPLLPNDLSKFTRLVSFKELLSTNASSPINLTISLIDFVDFLSLTSFHLTIIMSAPPPVGATPAPAGLGQYAPWDESNKPTLWTAADKRLFIATLLSVCIEFAESYSAAPENTKPDQVIFPAHCWEPWFQAGTRPDAAFLVNPLEWTTRPTMRESTFGFTRNSAKGTRGALAFTAAWVNAGVAQLTHVKESGNDHFDPWDPASNKKAQTFASTIGRDTSAAIAEMKRFYAQWETLLGSGALCKRMRKVSECLEEIRKTITTVFFTDPTLLAANNGVGTVCPIRLPAIFIVASIGHHFVILGVINKDCKIPSSAERAEFGTAGCGGVRMFA